MLVTIIRHIFHFQVGWIEVQEAVIRKVNDKRCRCVLNLDAIGGTPLDSSVLIGDVFLGHRFPEKSFGRRHEESHQ
jgi:hypothetical protein